MRKQDSTFKPKNISLRTVGEKAYKNILAEQLRLKMANSEKATLEDAVYSILEKYEA